MRKWVILSLSLLSIVACSAGSGSSSGNDDGGVADAGNLSSLDDSLDASESSDAQTDNGGAGDAQAGDAEPLGPTCSDGLCNEHETYASCPEDCPACSVSDALTDFERTLVELPPDTWYQAPDSKMRAVCVPDSVGVRLIVGCPAIVTAWNSGTLDTDHNEMYVWGGGHADYGGNEVYAFRLDNGTWERRTEPSVPPEGVSTDEFFNQDPLPDGRPVSRHTYDGVEYLPGRGKLFAHGGSRARDGQGTNVTWLYDVATKDWTSYGPHDGSSGGYTQAAANDPVTDKVYMRSSESFHIYDLKADSWRRIDMGYPPYYPRYAAWKNKTAAIDSVRRLYWTVGAQNIFIWDIDADKHVTDDWVTTGGGTYTNADLVKTRVDQLFESGGGDIYNANGPGFDYDSAADAMVAWVNTGGPYVLDLKTKVWTRMSDDGAPTSENPGGTFGRWRYVPSLNVFILVNSVDENVYFYKHTRCGG